MAIISLDGLSIPQLRDLQLRVDDLILEKEAKKKAELANKIAALADEAGFSINDLFEGGNNTPKTSSIKYRNPKNPSQTWSGRGRKPIWLNEAVGNGAKIESFEV